jgi:hypothetical protein
MDNYVWVHGFGECSNRPMLGHNYFVGREHVQNSKVNFLVIVIVCLFFFKSHHFQLHKPRIANAWSTK